MEYSTQTTNNYAYTNYIQLLIPGIWGYCFLRSFCAALMILSLSHLCPSSIFTSLQFSPRCDKEIFFGLENLSFVSFLLTVCCSSSQSLLEQPFPPWQWVLQQSPFRRHRHFLVEQPVVHLQLFAVNLFHGAWRFATSLKQTFCSSFQPSTQQVRGPLYLSSSLAG